MSAPTAIVEEVPAKLLVPISLRQRIKRLKVVFGLIFLLGYSNAVSAPNIPELITSTFGGNSYLVSGLFAGGSGLLACLYAPAVGAISDSKSRRWALLLTQVLSVLPVVAFLASQNYWAYAAVNTVLGLSGPTLSLLMTCVTDYIPPSCPARTETFAMTMFFFLLGVGTGPIVSMCVSVYLSFVIAGVCMLMAVPITYYLLPPPEKYRVEDEEARRAFIEAAVRSGRCPMLPSGRISMSYGSVAPPTAADGQDTQALLQDSQCPAASVQNGTDAVDDSVVAVTVDDQPVMSPTATGDTSQADAPPLGAVAHVKAAVARMRRVLAASRELRLVLFVVFWSCMCQEALETNLMLYLQNKLNFKSNDFTVLIVIVSVSGLISLGIVVSTLRRCLGTIRTLEVCIMGNVLFALGLCFVEEKWQALAVTTFGIFGYGVFPCSSSLVAHAVAQPDAGAAQGILTAMRMLAQAVGPVVFGALFNATQYTSLPGTPYLIGSACGLFALGSAIVVSKLVTLP
jgi:MFS family permease